MITVIEEEEDSVFLLDRILIFGREILQIAERID
jgi:hypothetical protein